MAQRPTSGSSTRSRRDEVWEMKRQRFLARKAAGQVGQPGQSGAARARPPALGQEQDIFGGNPISQAPSSPLSQLVKGGYENAGQQSVSSVHQPYGERPPSGSAFFPQQQPGSRGSHQRQQGAFQQQQQQPAYMAGGGGGGFNAGVAGQWNANVQQTRHDQQSRHDPNVSGPGSYSGGQRITQAPGGGANIDLSWQQPPRMPGGTPSNGSYRQQAYDSDPRSGAPGSRGSGQQFASPWGRDDDNLQQRQPQARREVCPFGQDGGAAPMQRAQPPQANPAPYMHAPQTNAPTPQARRGCPWDRDDVGMMPSGRSAPQAGPCDANPGRRGRPPGGASQIVFG